MSSRIILSVVFLAGMSPLATANQPNAGWIRINEGPFSVYTQGSPADAVSLIQSFQQLQSALAQGTDLHPDEGAELKIIAFRSEVEFAPYRFNPGSCAFYQQTGRAEYIVLQSSGASNREVSFHEFTHFAIAHSHLRLPLWLNEGLADFYSTFEISGDAVIFGRAVPGRLAILRSSDRLPISTLLNIAADSSYYSNPERMALFYSESWALAHMLVASPAYAPRFSSFLEALTAGQSSMTALQLAFSKTPAQVQHDLDSYLEHPRLPTIEKPFSPLLAAAAASSSLAKLSSAEMDVQLSDLSLSNPNSRAALQSRLAIAADQLPQNAAVEESLGFAALQQGKMEDARSHFRAAVDRRSSDPNVLFYLAHLDHAAGLPSARVMPLLEQALALNPALGDARLELALLATEDGDYRKALEALRKLTAPRPENAYAAAYTEAYCLANTDQLLEARAVAHRAQSLAANDRDRAEAAQLLGFINEQAQDPVPSATH